jgi:hypothetical protein
MLSRKPTIYLCNGSSESPSYVSHVSINAHRKLNIDLLVVLILFQKISVLLLNLTFDVVFLQYKYCQAFIHVDDIFDQNVIISR